MIRRLTNVTSKSFNNYSLVDDLAKVNILFGINGSGKSALSNWLFNQNPSNARKFDTSYVLNNIKAANSEAIKGVELTVGRDAIDNRENIERIEEHNTRLEETNKTINENTIRLKQELYAIMHTTLENAKIQFKTNKIRHKSNAQNDPVAAINLWRLDINANLNFGTTSSNADIELKIKEDETRKQNFKIINDKVTKERYDKFSTLMATETIVPDETVSSTLANWLSEGLKHHHLVDVVHENTSEIECKFCGEMFNATNIKQTIEDKINSEHAKLVVAFENIRADLLAIETKISELPNDFETEKRKALIEAINELKSKITDKITNTNQSIQIENNFYTLLEELTNLINIEATKIQEAIDENKKLVQAIEAVAKSWIGIQLQENQRVDEIQQELTSLSEKTIKNNKVISENRIWISEQQKVNSQVAPFVDLVNKHFKLLGLDFLLEISQSNQQTYDLKCTDPNATTLKADDLSEGERRLLAFLHFYYDLFDNHKNKTMVANVTTIIIDDPITSLDANNRYHLTKMITDFVKIIESNTPQLFIFTHSSMDFQNFSYGVKSNGNIEIWKINKNELGKSSLIKANGHDLKNISDHYQSIFADILDFALLGRNQIQEITYDCYKFANQARTIIESHARSHYKIGLASNNAEDELIRVYTVPEVKQDDFKKSLAVINISSHGTSLLDTTVNSYNPKEIQAAVRSIVATLYRKDSYHVESMVTRNNPLSQNKKEQIQRWL